MLAVMGGLKSEADAKLAQLGHVARTKDLMAGSLRSYRPRAEEQGGGKLSAELPDERQQVRITAEALLSAAEQLFTRTWNAQLTIDTANQQARADVTVPGQDAPLLTKVPVGHLLHLERELGTLATLVDAVPARDQSRTWTTDGQAAGIARSDTVEVDVTKKIPFNWVKSAATDKHPAQVEIMYEDRVVGYRATTLFSGALDQRRKDVILARISLLRQAVKQAREEANSAHVEDQAEGAQVFGYLFGEE
jgi:hypothetical protein